MKDGDREFVPTDDNLAEEVKKMDLGRILDGTPPVLAVEETDAVMEDIPLYAEKSGDYWMPVPMTESQMVLTDQVISSHYSDILKFFETNEPVMPESLDTLYQNVQLVASHPYLLVETGLPHSLLLKEVPAAIARSSGKFKVLGEVLDIIKDLKVHVALIVRPGKCIDLIEAFLLGKPLNYRRYQGQYLREPSQLDEDLSTLHILPSYPLESTYRGVERFHFVISFDQTVNIGDAHVSALRHQGRTDEAPVLRFIPMNTIEHVSQAFLGDVDKSRYDNEGLKKVLAAVVNLRAEVGEIPSPVEYVFDQGLAPLIPWLNNPSTPFILPPLPPVALYTAEDVEKSLLTEVGEDETTPETDNGSFYDAKRLKRDVEFIKPEPGIDGGWSSSGPSQKLSAGVFRKLESLLRETARQAVEIEDFRRSASSRQATVESLTVEMGDKVKEVNELLGRVKFAERRAERCVADAERASTRAEEATKELDQLRSVVAAESPEKDELLKLQAQLNDKDAEIKRLEERLQNQATENEYMRSEYQRASAQAAESQSKYETAMAENAELRKRAEGEMVKLRELAFDDERSMKDEQIRVLNARLQALEEHMKRLLESDNSKGTRSRGSRASSVSKRGLSPSKTPSDYTDRL
ncbi:HDA1 complex subunit 3 [Trichomonascus vanleenenianus]|uniref:Hda3p n=1 Tax=Trichomonascus vanleenenianus TaxID=2268995 RepID=UPI003ECA12C9